MRLTGSRANGMSGRIALFALFAAVVAMSALNSALRTDAHHWGLMLSNALDLSAGRIPYRNFIIQYGYFTTLVQSWWGDLFGFSFLSFGILTALFYCGLLYQVFAVIRHLGAPWAGALFLAVAFVLHPFPIYPWSDYYSGFFMSCAVALLYAHEGGTRARLIAAGALLGLAVWSRYTYIVAIVPFMIFVLITRRYPFRNWMAFFLAFVATNLAFVVVFKYGYGLRLLDALDIFESMAEGHGTTWISLERLENLPAITRVEDGFFIYIWVATLPLFFEAIRKKLLSRRELGAYATLSILGWINLVHAIRIFEYFRIVNASFALAIVSFWMIGVAVRALQISGEDISFRPRALIGFIRKAPLILLAPLVFVGFFSVRIVQEFPLSTFNMYQFDAKKYDTYSHAPGIWRDVSALDDLTFGKVGRVDFTHSDMLAFYRRLASHVCGKGTVYNFTLINVDYLAGEICDRATKVRTADPDRYLRIYDQPDYQRVYVRGELSRDDVIISTGRLFEDFLCLDKTILFAPHLEYVAAAGTAYVVRSNCVGKLTYGRGWWDSHRWAMDKHAEIHLMNHGGRTLRAKYRFTLGTFKPRHLTISLNGKVQRSVALIPDRSTLIRSVEFRLPPGDNVLQFDVDEPSEASSDPGEIHRLFKSELEFLALSEESPPN